MLKREQWLDLARKLDWTHRFVHTNHWVAIAMGLPGNAS
jgi:hypothetical protein